MEHIVFVVHDAVAADGHTREPRGEIAPAPAAKRSTAARRAATAPWNGGVRHRGQIALRTGPAE
jgi:hypothetical protein